MTSLFCKKYLSDYKSLEGLLLCQLIPFNKSPGIKPIRKGEVLRWIMWKTVTLTIKKDVQVAGSL